MDRFEYGDSRISRLEYAATVASMMLGIGLLSMPAQLSALVPSSDGWMSILGAGGLAVGAGVLMAKLASRFPGETFAEFGKRLIPRPLAAILFLTLAALYMIFLGLELKGLSVISKYYLFDRTPVEAVSLCFWLIVIYAVSGSRVGIVRLNLLFLPIVAFIMTTMLIMNINFFEVENLQPYFITDLPRLASGMHAALFSFIGFDIILIYTAMLNRPGEASRAAAAGLGLPLVFYLFVYVMVIGIFTPEGAANVSYPTVEIAKEIQVPGEFFERFESIFFVVFIMTIFNTSAMALDAAVVYMQGAFGKWSRQGWIVVLAPLIYIAAFIPRNELEMSVIAQVVQYWFAAFGIVIPIVLMMIARRGRKEPQP